MGVGQLVGGPSFPPERHRGMTNVFSPRFFGVTRRPFRSVPSLRCARLLCAAPRILRAFLVKHTRRPVVDGQFLRKRGKSPLSTWEIRAHISVHLATFILPRWRCGEWAIHSLCKTLGFEPVQPVFLFRGGRISPPRTGRNPDIGGISSLPSEQRPIK